MKKFFDWVFHVLSLVGAFFLGIFIYKRVKMMTPSKQLRFEPVPGRKDMINILDNENKNHIKKLPINPETKKQIKIDEIKSAGLVKGEYSVEIKHNRKSRFAM